MGCVGKKIGTPDCERERQRRTQGAAVSAAAGHRLLLRPGAALLGAEEDLQDLEGPSDTAVAAPELPPQQEYDHHGNPKPPPPNTPDVM